MMEDRTQCAGCGTKTPANDNVLWEDTEYPEVFCRDCFDKLGTSNLDPAPLRQKIAENLLSPRAHFAALAMQGLLANSLFLQSTGAVASNETEGASVTAAMAVIHADALLAALKEGE